MTYKEDTSQIYSRIGKIEQEQASILTSIQSMSSAITNLASEVKSLTNAGKTNWSVLASWSAVIIALMTAVGSLAINPIKESVMYNKLERKEAVKEQQEVTKLYLDQLEKSLRRELELTTEIIEKEIEALKSKG